MQLGMVGLGRMGLNMAVRLLRRGHAVAGTARSIESFATLEKEGGHPFPDLAAMLQALTPPRTVWVMVPAGTVTQGVLDELAASLAPGDLVVDGGNSRWTDSVARAAAFAPRKIGFVDAGTSGGVWGLENGYCLMVGGEAADVARLTPILRDLAPPDGYLHTGAAGSGHYCKMIHNGIEYGMLQAYGEGFEILARSRYGFDLHQVARLWNQGSVVRSWLLELAERAFAKDGRLTAIRGYVEDSGEGRWTVQEAIDLNVPAPVLTLSLQARFASRQDESFSAKVIAALRNEFGGHPVKKAE